MAHHQPATVVCVSFYETCQLTVTDQDCRPLLFYYRPQHSCGKFMFSQASVILFTGGGTRMHLGRHPPGQTPPMGRHPPGPTPARRPLQWMHPTGMHSCIMMQWDCLSHITNTGRERLIRSHSSARFCFKLSGNSN